jgi:hypothetical protein
MSKRKQRSGGKIVKIEFEFLDEIARCKKSSTFKAFRSNSGEVFSLGDFVFLTNPTDKHRQVMQIIKIEKLGEKPVLHGLWFCTGNELVTRRKVKITDKFNMDKVAWILFRMNSCSRRILI